MTRLERYKEQLAKLEHKRGEFMRRGKYMEMQRLAADIDEVKRLISEAEPKPVTELFSPEQLRESGLVPAIVEVHLAADYLAACCYTVEDIVKKLGGVPVSVIPELKEIIKKSNAFCSFLYEKDEDLRNLITDDETLMNALHKKSLSYMNQRLRKNDH
jgi:hypothetical protein